jgi:hypothetical protein
MKANKFANWIKDCAEVGGREMGCSPVGVYAGVEVGVGS